MKIVFDPAKNERNIRERGISFQQAAEFDFDTAVYDEDRRREYGEKRFIALGWIGIRLCVLVFTYRGESLRVISLRKANSREVRRYEKETSQS